MFQRKIVENFLALFSGEAVSKLLGFITTIYLARVLGTEGFGMLGFVLAVYSFFVQLANQGFETVGAREIARGSATSPMLHTLFSLRSLFSIVAFGLLLLFSFAVHLDSTTRALLIFQGVNLLLLSFNIQYVFRGLEVMWFVSANRIIQSLSYLILVVFSVKGEREILLIPFYLFVSTVLGLIPLGLAYTKRTGDALIRLSLKAWAPLLKASIPIGLSTLMIQIYYSFDSVLLGFFQGSEEVGLYTAAYRIILFLGLLQSLFFQAIFPSLSRLWEENREHLKVYAENLLLMMLGVSAAMTVLVFTFAGDLTNHLYGVGFSRAVPILKILVFAMTFVYNESVTAALLIATGNQMKHLICVSVGAFVNCVANFIMIPQLGAIGAALATLLTEVFVFGLLFSLSLRVIGLDMEAFLRGALVAWTLAAIFLLVSKAFATPLYLAFLLAYFFRQIRARQNPEAPASSLIPLKVK